MRRFFTTFLSLSAIVATCASCVIVDPSTCNSGGASILITPSVVVVAVGQTSTPRASWCRNGRYDSLSPRWSLGSTADANIISVDATSGAITGKRTGNATVVATYEGVDGGSVSVSVR
jgi:hypothetical protein